MKVDQEIFKWIKSIGAQDMSLDADYKHSREMCMHIYEVHKHLFFMRKLYGNDDDGYRHHMTLCQNSLARIEFLVALSGGDTKAPSLSKMFMQMAHHESITYRLRPRVDSAS